MIDSRIRAHVVLCWLALLPALVAENAAGQTWPAIRRQLDRIAVDSLTSENTAPSYTPSAEERAHPSTSAHSSAD